MTNFEKIISTELNISEKSVAATIKLLNDGATIPFISRYRKEVTGSLDEVTIRDIQLRYAYLQELAKRKEYILETIEAAGALTIELRQKIEQTFDATTLEDGDEVQIKQLAPNKRVLSEEMSIIYEIPTP